MSASCLLLWCKYGPEEQLWYSLKKRKDMQATWPVTGHDAYWPAIFRVWSLLWTFKVLHALAS